MIEEELYQLKIKGGLGGAAESKIGVHHQSLIVPPALVKVQSVDFFENEKIPSLEVQAIKVQ